MTYALGTARLSAQSNEGSARKGLPVLRTPRKNVRAAPRKTASYGALQLAETPEEVQRKEALEEIFVASRQRFLATAYSILRNREDAEDAVQTAFLSAYRRLDSFEGRSALKTWFTRIVLNAALMMRRKRKPVATRVLSGSGGPHDDGWIENIQDSQPDPEMIHAEHETFQFIDEKLENLRPGLRQAFRMTYYDDLSGSEACAKLGVSSGTFKARLFHARRKLLEQTERTLVAPMRKTNLSTPESYQRH